MRRSLFDQLWRRAETFLNGEKVPASELGFTSLTRNPRELVLGTQITTGKAESEWITAALTKLCVIRDRHGGKQWCGVPWRLLRNEFMGAHWLDALWRVRDRHVPNLPEEGVREYRFALGRPPGWWTRMPLLGSQRFRHPEFELMDGMKHLLEKDLVIVMPYHGQDYVVPTQKLLEEVPMHRSMWAEPA